MIRVFFGDMEKIKRNRSANFTHEEVRLLLKLAVKNKNILEDKKNDAHVWQLKATTWAKIAKIFNATSLPAGKTARTTETLKLKYEGLKHKFRKKLNKTAGGISAFMPVNGTERYLLELHNYGGQGCRSDGDADEVLPQTTADDECSFVEEIDQLPVISLMSPDIREGDVFQDITMSDTSAEDPGEGCSGHQQEDTLPNNNPEDKEKGSTPSTLRTRNCPVLNAHGNNGEDKIEKIDNLLALREELVREQISAQRETEKRDKEKHEEYMAAQREITRREKEKHDIELRILQLKEKLIRQQCQNFNSLLE